MSGKSKGCCRLLDGLSRIGKTVCIEAAMCLIVNNFEP